MKELAFALLFLSIALMNCANVSKNENALAVSTNLINISQQLLLAAKTKEATDSFVHILQSLPDNILEKQLDNDKKAFWINLYNLTLKLSQPKTLKSIRKKAPFLAMNKLILAAQN